MPCEHTTDNRLAELETLFTEARSEIRDRLLADPFIIPVAALDVDRDVLEGLAKRLYQYDGPINEVAFTDWAVSVTTTAARVAALHRQFGKAVLNGVWKVLKNATDLGFDDGLPEQIAQDAWGKFICEDKLALLTHNRGLPRWFQEMGRFAGLAWRKERLRERDKFRDLGASDRQATWTGRTKPKGTSDGPTWGKVLTTIVDNLSVESEATATAPAENLVLL